MLYICNIKYNAMQTTSIKTQTAFRFDSELLRRLKIKAKQENRSLNNYVETVLMDIVYDEPNDTTLEAIEDARKQKDLTPMKAEQLEQIVESL